MTTCASEVTRFLKGILFKIDVLALPRTRLNK